MKSETGHKPKKQPTYIMACSTAADRQKLGRGEMHISQNE
jgi:hypothetical protein